MHSTIALVALQAFTAFAFPGALEERQACRGDNCLRAVSNTRSLARATSDCLAFFRTTVIPCSTTTVVTSTVTTTSASGTVTVTATTSPTTTVVVTSTTLSVTSLGKRQAGCPFTRSPALVPSYASACSGTARFSSACSCLGVTSRGTTTAATPVSTSVVTTTTTLTTATATVTTTVTALQTTTSIRVTTVQTTVSSSSSTTTSAPPTCSTYVISNSNGGEFSGQVLQREFRTGTIVLGPGSGARLLTVQADGKLSQAGQNELAATELESSVGQSLNSLLFDSNPKPTNLICKVSGGVLTCVAPSGENNQTGANTFYVCPDYTQSQSNPAGRGVVYLSDNQNLPSGCQQLRLVATPRC